MLRSSCHKYHEKGSYLIQEVDCELDTALMMQGKPREDRAALAKSNGFVPEAVLPKATERTISCPRRNSFSVPGGWPLTREGALSKNAGAMLGSLIRWNLESGIFITLTASISCLMKSSLLIHHSIRCFARVEVSYGCPSFLGLCVIVP